MSHKELSYYTSERFIHDELIQITSAAVDELYEAWKENGHIDPFIMSWPSETILSDEGVPLEGACLYELPPARDAWAQLMLDFTRATKAYALLLVEQKENHVSAILESHHGTQSWTIPIQTSGDRYVLGNAEQRSNLHSIGLLWTPQTTYS